VSGKKAGTDTVRAEDGNGNSAQVQIVVSQTLLVAPVAVLNPGGPLTALVNKPGSVQLHCQITATATKSTTPVALTQDVTVRDAVAKGNTCNYSAAVSGGQTYVLSLTGIIGAAQLKVFNDPKHTQPTSCLAPKNLGNSTFMQPADCTFLATGSSVYATVTGTTYPRGTLRYSYNIRLSPHFEAKAKAEGELESPKPIGANKPYGGTAPPGWTQSSYYVVDTTGSSEVLISMTGLTGRQGLDLRIFENPKYQGHLDNEFCYTGEFGTHPESCVLSGGKVYYIEIENFPPDVGGPFTLMVDAPGAKAAPAPAVPRAPAAAISTSATP
jgi:hypothetical protein